MDEQEKIRLMRLDEEVDNHCWNNRAEIESSEICLCTACYSWFSPEKVIKWRDSKHACCPVDSCGLTGVILGSASDLKLEEHDHGKGTDREDRHRTNNTEDAGAGTALTYFFIQ